jgi:hypothetical protein
MSDLGQQLRELGRDQFESLVHQILMAKYPNAGIKKVDGAGGDEGIDSFEGTLDSRPAIWQSKHFINGIKKAQRSQILKSIKAAFAKRKPSRWTLCVPINLQTNEHAWFQSNIVQPYGRKCQIRLLQGSDILSDLYPNRTLRDAFFPENSISNVMKVREMAMKTELMSPVERKMVATEYAQQFLEAKENLDPRLKGVFSVGHSSSYWDACQENGALVSVSEGETVTTFFPRNVTE